MNLQHDRISELCQGLKLERIGSDWSHLAQRAANGEASFADFLETLLSAEADARAERSRQTLLKMAAFPAVKTLEHYDFAFASGAPRAQLQELAALSFIERRTSSCLAPAAWARATWRLRWPTAPSWRGSRHASSARPT